MRSHILRAGGAMFVIALVALGIAYLTGSYTIGDIAFTALLAFLAGYLVRETEEPAP